MAEAIRRDTRLNLLVTWKEWLKDQNWRVIFTIGLLTVVLTAPIYYHRIFGIIDPGDTDYTAHITFTQQMLQGNPLDPAVLSHPALQFILAAMYLLTARFISLRGLLLLLQVVVQVFTALILYNWFGKASRRGWDGIRAAVAVTLTFVAPLMLLVFVDNFYYLGYVGLANYHNPTIHLLQPVALLSFLYAINAIEGRRSSWWSVLLSAFWMTLSTWMR